MAKAAKDANTDAGNGGPVWDYYDLKIRLIREMLGTNPEASIMEIHIHEKAKKNIKEANRLSGRMRKSLDKYRGAELTEDKEIMEIQGIIRAYAELTGQALTDLPDNLLELETLFQEVEQDFTALVKSGEEVKATVFQKWSREFLGMNGDGDPSALWPVVSTHMLLGNLKENLKIIVNNGDKSILKTKVSVGETLSMDVKAVQEFMVPNMDIDRYPDGKRKLLERPIRFKDAMGRDATAISLSEVLPKDTEMGCTLRVRRGSPIDAVALKKILGFGINNGLGQWRGSGHKGAYIFQLKKLRGYTDPDIPAGWNV